jgi:hypothetical protein
VRCLTLVYSIYDSTEEAIQKMIEASQRMINEQQHGNPAINEHFKLQIKTLQNAPRDEEKLERLLKVKERQNDAATHIEDTQRLVTEIEMLKVVLYLVCRNNDTRLHGERQSERDDGRKKIKAQKRITTKNY